VGPCGEDPARDGRRLHGPCRGRLLQHEREQPREDGGDGPGGIPRARVEVAHGQAQPRVGLEPPVGRDHVDAWRLERVLGRELELAPEEPALVRGPGWAGDHVVPLEDVGL